MITEISCGGIVLHIIRIKYCCRPQNFHCIVHPSHVKKDILIRLRTCGSVNFLIIIRIIDGPAYLFRTVNQSYGLSAHPVSVHIIDHPYGRLVGNQEGVGAHHRSVTAKDITRGAPGRDISILPRERRIAHQHIH